MNVALHSAAPRYDKWVWALILSVHMLPLVLAVAMIAQSQFTAAWILFAVTGGIAFLFWSVLPRGYEVWPDSLRILLGWPFALNVPFDTIVNVRPGQAVMRSRWLSA